MEDSVLQLTVLLITILCGTWLYRRYTNGNDTYESFQTVPYIYRKDNDIYDTFYIDEYNILYETEKYAKEDFANISSIIPVLPNKTILDVGCGNGVLLKEFENNGNYNIVGVDKSKAMIESTQETIKIGEPIEGDILHDPMRFEKETFDIILCTHFTIYEIQNKSLFFRYCYHWLKIGGFFVIHIVDVEKYNMIPPNSELFPHLKSFSATKDRVTSSVLEKSDYTFSSSYTNVDDESMTRIETFEHKNKVRKNELSLFMTNKNTIISDVEKNGFKFHSEIHYNKIPDKYQSLAFFVKM